MTLVLVVFYLADSFLYLLNFVRQRNRHDSIFEMFSNELQFQLSLNSNGAANRPNANAIAVSQVFRRQNTSKVATTFYV